MNHREGMCLYNSLLGKECHPLEGLKKSVKKFIKQKLTIQAAQCSHTNIYIQCPLVN